MKTRKSFASLLPDGIAPAHPFKLYRSDGSEVAPRDIIGIAQTLCLKQAAKDSFSAPAATKSYLRLRLGPMPYEIFAALLLDNRHRLIEYRELFRGTIDGASVHPREVVRDVLRVNAAAVVFAHNHPSGVAEPSTADELITKRLQDALSLVDVRVLDHIVIGGESAISLAERGLL